MSTHPHRPVEQAAYRQLMSAFPTGVTVVTTLDRDGLPAGLTCSSLTSVTLDPPTLLVCVHQDSRPGGLIVERGSFAVNLLHSRGRDAAEVFAGSSRDRFCHVSWAPSPALGLPWLTTCALAVAECYVSDTRVVGDHTVIFGQVVGARQQQDVPLLYGLRRFSSWTGGE